MIYFLVEFLDLMEFYLEKEKPLTFEKNDESFE
jgi:hypothetical protein